MKIFLLLSLTLTVALAVPVPEWVPIDPKEGVPLAGLLPRQGYVILEDVKPDAGLEKVDRPPAEVSPKVEEKPAEQETVVQDKPAEQEPLVQDKPAEQEPLVEDKPAEQEPLVEDKPAEQEPLVEDKPAEQEPLIQDKPAEQEPLVQDKPAEEEPLVQDKPAEEKPLVEDKPAEQEPLEEDKPAEEEPLVEDKPAEQELSVEQVVEEDISVDSAEEKDLTENEIKDAVPAKEETQLEENVVDENVYDRKESLDTNFLPEQGPAMERNYVSDEAAEEEAVEQEINPAPGRPRLVEEPVMELVPEDEEAGMDGRLTEEKAEMVEEPIMELITEEGPVEDDVGADADLMWDPRFRSVEEPRVELEPLLEEEATLDDEPGTEAQPAEEEDLLGEEGPVMPGETVVEVEESQDEEPGVEMEPEEEPVPWARSGLAEGPLMDGMTLKQAMMEEEPDMWVGPDVIQEGPVQEVEEDPSMSRTGDESMAMARGMDMDSLMMLRVNGDMEEARPYEQEARAMEAEEAFSDAVSTKWSSCSGTVIDGRCYQFYRGPKQAPDAEFFCQRNFPNGHLASVTNPYIHQQMKNLMAQGGNPRTWVGGLKYLKTGTFIWLDGARWEYADWLPGEPNDTSGVEDCIELLSNGKFNDMPCWDLRAFICSYPL